MQSQSRLLACWTVGILLSLSTVSFGQESGSITGTVKDSTGASVPSANVTVTNPTNAISQAATTNDAGSFTFPDVRPGTYSVVVEKAGFKKLERSKVILTTAGKLDLGEFRLEVGGLAETVTVQADAGQLQLQTVSGERSDVLTNNQLINLAINGRNVLDLTRIVPGITNVNQGAQSTVNGEAGTFNVNGTRSNMHVVTINGAKNMNTGNNSGMLVTVNPDAVGEVRVLTSNYQAEYGRAGGGYVEMTIKSGTNDYHASARYFRRHDSMNADSFFNNVNGLPRSIYRYNFYGYDFGGPIPVLGSKRNRKLFFFWSQEFYRQFIPNTARNIQFPTALERQGDFSQSVDGTGARIYVRDPLASGNCTAIDASACFPGNKIPASRIYTPGQAILKFYPSPNVAGLNNYNYTSQNSDAYPRREYIARIDYNINDSTRLSGHFVRNSDNQLLNYGTTSASWNWPLSVVSRQNGPGYALGFVVTHNFSPTLVNEFNYAPSFGAVSIGPTTDAPTATASGINVPLLFPDANPAGYIPNFTYGGITGQTFPTMGFSGSPFNQRFRIDTVIDNITKVWGTHVTKAGVYWQRSRNGRTSFTNVQGTISFANDANNPLSTGDPYANALLGAFDIYDQANTKVQSDWVYSDIEAYIQDTWKVTSRFSLDYGMRFSHAQPVNESERQLSFFSPAAYDPSKASRLYYPVCVSAAPCSGANRRSVDPAQLVPGFVATTANTQPPSYVGLIVPNSGNLLNGIVQVKNGYPPGGFDTAKVLWGPRFGFAWDLTGKGNTVVRSGFGITYDRVRDDVTGDAIGNPPNVTDPAVYYGYLSDIPSLRGSGGVMAPLGLWGISPAGKVPNIYTYSLGVQHNVGFGTMVDISYVGTLGRHLARVSDPNALPYGTTFTRAAQDSTAYAGGVVPTVQPGLPLIYSQAGLSFTGANALPVNFLRPYQGIGDISYRSFDATSNYNSLQVSVNRRFSSNLTFGFAYTFAKTFTTANDDTTTFTNPFNTRGYNYQLANFDRTHVAVLNYVYTLPKLASHLGGNAVLRGVMDNWQLSGLSQFVTGTPVTLSMSVSGVDAGQRISGAYTTAATIISGGTVGSGLAAQSPSFFLNGNPNGTNGISLNPNAFVVPAINNIGPYPLTYLRNPSWMNHDVSLFKNFPLGHDGARFVQLRLEAFNVFNHPQFTAFNTSTNLSVPNGTDASGNQVFITGASIFNNNAAGTGSNYSSVIISNNIRGQRTTDKTKPLGTFLGEYTTARDPRIIELAIKVYF